MAFSNFLFAQDCDSYEVDFGEINQLGDSTYLSNLLDDSNADQIICELQKISQKYFQQFDYKQALLFSQALEHRYVENTSIDSNLILRNWEVLSNSYHEIGLPDSVLVYGKKLLFALDRRIDQEPKELTRILEIVVMSFIDKLQYDLAMEWVDLIGFHLMSKDMEDSPLFAGMLYLKGVVRTMENEIEDAVTLMDSIENWFVEHPIANEQTLARAHTLQIRLNLFLGNQDGLEYHISNAQKLLNKTAPIDTSTFISYLLNKSYYHLIMGEEDAEKEVTDEALRLSEEFKAVPILKAKVLLFQGTNYGENNNYVLACKNGERALLHLSSGTFNSYSFHEFKHNLIEFLSYQLSNLQLSDSSLNLSQKIWLNDSIALKHLERKIYKSNEQLSNLKISIEDLSSFGEKIISLWQYYDEKSANISFNSVFNFFESYKSFIFNHYKSRDHIYTANSNNIAILNEENELRNQILKLSKNNLAPDYNNMANYYSLKTILKKRKQYNFVLEDIRKKHNHLSEEIKTLSTTSFLEIQNIAIEKNETFISYILHRNYIYSMVIGPNSYSFNRVRSPSEQDLFSTFNQLNNFHSSPDSSNFDDYVFNNHKLYEYLIKPIEDKLTENIVIIPHSKIYDIPFAALISDVPTDPTNFNSYNWLINIYNFSYSPSIGSYILNNSVSQNISKPKTLAVAPKFNSSKNISLIRNDLSKLIYNMEEVQTIENQTNATILVANKSTRENILRHFQKSNIIHFATHTITNEESDYTTNLVLSTGITDSFELVEVDKIFPKNNSTNLVVLSACNSGKGKVIQGEGKLTLAHNFFKNGANVVISNLWDASDYSMKEIFSSFYKKLENEKSISESLRMAQKDYLQKMPNELKHPFYWSGLTATGNSNTIFKNTNNTMFLIFGGFMLIFLIWGFFKLKD